MAASSGTCSDTASPASPALPSSARSPLFSQPESQRDADLSFPPNLAPVGAVWQWQSEAGWHCFSPSQCETLEVGWAAGRAVVHLRLGPWAYRIDLNNMVQQNTATRRMRHIRRSTRSAALWFWESTDGTATRYDPQVEASLEAAHCEWTEKAGGSPGGVSSPAASTASWSGRDGHCFVADLEKMTETCRATGAVRRICRCVLRPEHRLDEDMATSRKGTTLPSLRVGIDESGACRCAGNLRVADPEDLNAVLLPVEEVVDDVCAICLDPLEIPCLARRTTMAVTENSGDSEEPKEVVKLKNCSHMYHRECVLVYVSRADRGGFACPTCSTVQCTGNGPSPAGTMKWKIDQAPTLGGYSASGTIYVEYDIPRGIQSARHARPGSPFAGTRRFAYLPDTTEGREILSLLIHAFVKGHTFTVGTSLTTGRSDVVVWNGIHHKTNRSGASPRILPAVCAQEMHAFLLLPAAVLLLPLRSQGPAVYGYPDASYFDRVRAELEAKGVTRALLSSPDAAVCQLPSVSPEGNLIESGEDEGKPEAATVSARSGVPHTTREGASACEPGDCLSSSSSPKRRGDSRGGTSNGRRAMRGACCGLSTAAVRTPPVRRGQESVRTVTCRSVDETPASSLPQLQAPLDACMQSSENNEKRLTRNSGCSRSRRESREHVPSSARDDDGGRVGGRTEEARSASQGANTVGTGASLTHFGEMGEEGRKVNGLERKGLAELTEADKALKRCRSKDILSAQAENYQTHRGCGEPRETSKKPQ
uniref:RING-type E3 ubiquitin transferase n=1 Tax=Neospora caninum (strain Liverpool) TaxID=572307 RepID=A0A0F7UHQ9_NEOCL|nr:TPA: zinc finger (C3HC4 RING finger) protein,putative [Neospora caninum Liverpool]